jgi:hypothetical protein
LHCGSFALSGLLFLSFFSSAAGAIDGAKNNKAAPQTPMEKFDALKAGFDQAKKEWTKSWTKASAGKGREGLLDYLEEHPYPNQQFAKRFLALARENPHSRVASLALTWVIKNSRQFVSLQLVDQALTIIAADHLQDAKLLETCQNPPFRAAPAVERFLRVVLEKHPDRKVRGFACLDLAEGLRERSELRAELEVLDEKPLALQGPEAGAGRRAGISRSIQ